MLTKQVRLALLVKGAGGTPVGTQAILEEVNRHRDGLRPVTVAHVQRALDRLAARGDIEQLAPGEWRRRRFE